MNCLFLKKYVLTNIYIYDKIMLYFEISATDGLLWVTTVEQKSFKPTVWAHLFFEVTFLEYVRLF